MARATPARPALTWRLLTCTGLLAACSGTSATASSTIPATTTTAAVPTTSVPVTTTAPTTTLAPTTTVASTTTAPAPPETVPAPEPGAPTWPAYTPLPGVSGVAALTNLAVDEATSSGAIVAVKIDNAPAARPQWRLDAADVVFEENVEQLTRFVALFHSRQPGEVGPVRSVRTSDLPVLAALNRPALAWSGANRYVTRAVRNAVASGLFVDVGVFASGRCYRRERSRSAPHNLMVDVGCVRAAAIDAGPARPLWTFDDNADLSAALDAPVVQVAMDAVSATWTFDAALGRYRRAQNGKAHQAWGGDQVSATNVVVLGVRYIPSAASANSPEAVTVGSGPLVVNRGGKAIVGTWTRGAPTAPFDFRDAAGAVIALASGTTWVELSRS